MWNSPVILKPVRLFVRNRTNLSWSLQSSLQLLCCDRSLVVTRQNCRWAYNALLWLDTDQHIKLWAREVTMQPELRFRNSSKDGSSVSLEADKPKQSGHFWQPTACAMGPTQLTGDHTGTPMASVWGSPGSFQAIKRSSSGPPNSGPIIWALTANLRFTLRLIKKQHRGPSSLINLLLIRKVYITISD